jgi:hypothetical protein
MAAVQRIHPIETPDHVKVTASHCHAIVHLQAVRVDLICFNPSDYKCHTFERNSWDLPLLHPQANRITYRKHEQTLE